MFNFGYINNFNCMNNYYNFYNNCYFPFMNFFMPANCMTIFPFQSFLPNRQVSIWLQQTEHPVPKLIDSLVIKSAKNNNSVETSNKKESSKEPSRTIINGIEYNAQKGQALADRILAGLPEYSNYPLCARYVKEAIRDVGLGPYINGNGEYCKYILRANPNFKETKVKGNDLKNLPAGCIIVYDKYDGGYGKDGHVEITLGDGRACSDVITDEIVKSDNTYVFIPV